MSVAEQADAATTRDALAAAARLMGLCADLTPETHRECYRATGGTP